MLTSLCMYESISYLSSVCHSVHPSMYLQCHVIWLVDPFRDRHRVDNNEECEDELK